MKPGSVLFYTRRRMQNVLAFRDSPITPLRRSPSALCVAVVGVSFGPTRGARNSSFLHSSVHPSILTAAADVVVAKVSTR